MIVRCVSQYPNEDQLKYLGLKFFKDRAFGVILGREYIVFALTIVVEPDASGRGLFLDHLTETNYGNLVRTPACLFEIVDGTASRYWEVRVREDGTVTLWPPSFYREYYHDDLSEGLPDVVEDFRRIRALIEAEAVGHQQLH
jgi:hypothetical protein